MAVVESVGRGSAAPAGSVAALIAFVLALAGCGRPSFDGTFTGPFQGRDATLVLAADGDRLTGSIRWGGEAADVVGKATGAMATGTVRHPTMRVELPFEAKLDGDRIEWEYKIVNQATGQTDRLPITFTRGKTPAASVPAGGAAAGGLDPGLVGRWYSEVGGSLASGNTAMTRLHVSLAADGTFEYGGADTLLSLRDSPGGEGATGGVLDQNVTRGRWKSEGGVLYYQAALGEGAAQWIPLGRYILSGSTDLMLYSADGGKQLWSRE